jgi:hypothetical protein
MLSRPGAPDFKELLMSFCSATDLTEGFKNIVVRPEWPSVQNVDRDRASFRSNRKASPAVTGNQWTG